MMVDAVRSSEIFPEAPKSETKAKDSSFLRLVNAVHTTALGFSEKVKEVPIQSVSHVR